MVGRDPSGRLPAADELTTEQCAEIARRHTCERPHRIAERLGVSKRLVKAEVRRLRIGGRSSAVRTASRLFFALAVLGAALTGFASLRMRTEASFAARAPAAPVESEAARDLYRKLDRGAASRDEIVAKLEDQDAAVRLAAVRAYLGSTAAQADARPLLPRLNDPEERIRLATIQALGALGDPRAVAPLAAIVRSPRASGERGLALDALARIPDDESVSALIAALADPVASIRVRAFELLSRRLKTSLGCDAARVEREPEVVRDVFRTYWKEGHR